MTAVPMVDWAVASATGERLATAGPAVSADRAAEVVDGLRRAAALATEPVAAATGLPGPLAADVLVVGRRRWVKAATAMSQAMLDAVGHEPPGTLGQRVAARFAGAQVGAAFAFVAARILGQFDPFSARPRLLLVAPNIVQAERSMPGSPEAFRQWVCLHEETHRFQFGAAPWLPAYLIEQMGRLFDDEPDGGRPASEARQGPDPLGRISRLLSPDQSATLDRITAVMSLLEGHADVMMDRAADPLVPQASLLRRAMEARRDAPGFAQFVARVLGLRAKREQYLHGATFCRAVIAEVGVDGLNLAFADRQNLPTLTELHEPSRWVQRVPRRAA